jgi:hypothetical protein
MGALPGMLAPEGGLTLAPVGSQGVLLKADRSFAVARATLREHDDPHLRSCKAVTGYYIKAQDGEIGHVNGWIVGEASSGDPLSDRRHQQLVGGPQGAHRAAVD